MAAPLFWSVFSGITCLKALLIPSYKSTDFEVHRNWLAITHSLPFDKWYYEETSEWTLDYPPFFAWFEYGLSHIAKLFDDRMLLISNLNYSSEMTILFQRITVIFTDIVFAFAVRECCKCIPPRVSQSKTDVWTHPGFILAFLLLGNVGLIMVDHIHFQYNGFLFGLLLMSIARMLQFRYLESAFWFLVLLNFKHIFLYIAPAYFVFLLRSYCFHHPKKDGFIHWSSFRWQNFTKLALLVVGVFTVSFGPFIWKGQLLQVLSRLFPFKRGLCHAYWAPNFWVVYNILDKALVFIVNKTELLTQLPTSAATMTGGLVQEYKHAILPTITPAIAMFCSTLAIMPALWKLWKQPNTPWDFIRCLISCAFATFMFGWHVHEKAILLVIIPLTLLAMVNWDDASLYLLLSLTGHFSLFPLFFTDAETPSKILLLILHGSYAFFSLKLLHSERIWVKTPLLSSLETLYIAGFVGVQLFQQFLHELFSLDIVFPFLPLLLFSTYCSVGIMYSWLKFYRRTLHHEFKPWEK